MPRGVRRPKTESSLAEKEMDRVQTELDAFQNQMKEASSLHETAKAPVVDTEPQTKISKREVKQYDAPVIKPAKTFFAKEKFDESKFGQMRKRGWEYVKVIVENNEVKGENVELWCKPWPGEPCHFWQVPVNNPIYIPRFLAEHLASRMYHRFKMQDRSPGEMIYGEPMQKMIVEETYHRINCRQAGGF